MTTFPHLPLVIAHNGEPTAPDFSQASWPEERIVRNISGVQFQTGTRMSTTPLCWQIAATHAQLRWIRSSDDPEREAWIEGQLASLQAELQSNRWRAVFLHQQRRDDEQCFHHHVEATEVSRRHTDWAIAQILANYGINQGVAQAVHAKILENLSPDEAAPVAEPVDPEFRRRLGRYTHLVATLTLP